MLDVAIQGHSKLLDGGKKDIGSIHPCRALRIAGESRVLWRRDTWKNARYMSRLVETATFGENVSMLPVNKKKAWIARWRPYGKR